MRRTIVGLFKSRVQAEKALKEIEDSGFANSEISIVIKNTPDTGQELNAEYADEITGQPQMGMLHDFDSFLVQAPTIELPETGPVSAAGPFAGALMQEDKGISKTLTYYGVSLEKAQEIEDKVGQGSVLTVIETDSSKASNVANVLAGYGASNVQKWNKNNHKPLRPWNAD